MTQHYDFYGNPINPHRGRGRKGHDPVASTVLGLVASIVFALACLAIIWAVNHARAPEEAKQEAEGPKGPTHDSMTVTYTYDGEAIRYYVMTDPDTQRQYIVNDRGGMCLREPHQTTTERQGLVRNDDGTVTVATRDSEGTDESQ